MKKEFFITSNDGLMIVAVRAKNIIAARVIASKLFAKAGH
jgi:hypothetical protein